MKDFIFNLLTVGENINSFEPERILVPLGLVTALGLLSFVTYAAISQRVSLTIIFIPLAIVALFFIGIIDFSGSLSLDTASFTLNLANISQLSLTSTTTLLFFGWATLILLMSFLIIFLSRNSGPEYLIGFHASLLTIAVIYGNRLIDVGFAEVSAATVIFASSFYLTDVISEHWGRRAARKSVLIGLVALLTVTIVTVLFSGWPARPGAQEAAQLFDDAMSQTGRIAFAIMVAYYISQELDVWLYARFKQFTAGRLLWLRNNASTMISQLLSTIIFSFLAFYGEFWLLPFIIGTYAVNVIFSLIDTPFLYLSYVLLGRKPRSYIEDELAKHRGELETDELAEA